MYLAVETRETTPACLVALHVPRRSVSNNPRLGIVHIITYETWRPTMHNKFLS